MDGIPILDTTPPPCSQYLLALEASNTDEYFHTKFPVVNFPDNPFFVSLFRELSECEYTPVVASYPSIPHSRLLGEILKYWHQ